MGGGWSTPLPSCFTPGKEIRYPLYRRLDGASGPVWKCVKNLTHAKFRSLDRSARNESLYRLSYSGPLYFIARVFVYSCWVLNLNPLTWKIWWAPNNASIWQMGFILEFNPLTPNDTYGGRTAPLTSKRCILYIYSTNTGTEYFKHGIYSPFFFLFKMQFVS